MRHFKYVVLFCVCLSLEVESKDFPGISQNDEDILGTAEGALEDLEKIINAVVNIALKSISGVESTVKILEEIVLTLAKNQINILGDEIFAKLDELKKEANTIGVDIIECTENREDDLKQLLVTFLDKTGDCAVERVDEVFDSFAAVVMDVENANDLVKNLTQRLENCKSESDANACIVKVLEDITDAALEIPPKVLDDIDKTKKVTNELEDYLFECYHDNYNLLEITALEIYNGIVECIQDKLQPY